MPANILNAVDLAQLGSDLTKAWAARSNAEQNSLRVRLETEALVSDTAESPEDHAIAEALAAAERTAALSGAVQPEDLVQGLSPDLRSRVLDRLGPQFDRTAVQGAWQWTFRSDRRDAVLRQLPTPDLAEAVRQARSIKTDQAGDFLRRLASGDRGAVEAVDSSAPLDLLQALVQALSWATPLDASFAETIHQVRRQSSIAGILAGYDRLAGDSFVGRDVEIERLRRFVTDPADAGSIPVLTVTGLGGSGKSTLLAQALRPLVSQGFGDEFAPMVVSIDFDRRLFLDGGELELSYELTRQIGYYTPAIAAELAKLRDEVRQERAGRGEDGKVAQAQLESLHRDSLSFESRAGSILRRPGVATRPLVLVMDTFEEWQRETYSTLDPNAPGVRLLEWLSDLKTFIGVPLRLIISGRAPPPGAGFSLAPDPVDLKDLGPGEPAKLLRRLGVRGSAAPRLARIAGGIPLSLKLAAAYYLKLPEDQREAFLKDDDKELTGADSVLRQGLLYRRFLGHIPDPEARKLAHPGLALRQVTAELIRHVLAGPCELGAVSEARSKALFQLLAREVWLVELRGDALVHRSDTRQSMLRFMSRDPEQRPKVLAVHAAAEAWYSPSGEHPDPAEALYHHLAGAAGSSLLPLDEYPAGLLERLAGRFGDFDDGVRVRLQYRLGRRISDADAALLPEPERREWASRRGADMVAHGQPERAIGLFASQGWDGTAEPWWPQATFQGLAWKEEIDHRIDEDGKQRDRLTYHWLMAFVQSLSAEPRDRLLNDMGAYNPFFVQRIGRSLRFANMQRFLENIYFAQVLLLRDPESGAFVEDKRLRPIRLSTASDWLRCYALGPAYRDLFEINARHLLIGLFKPTTSWLVSWEQRLAQRGFNTDPLVGFVQAFSKAMAAGPDGRTAASRPFSTEVLGRWADDFADVVVQVLTTFDPALFPELLACRGDDPEWRLPIRTALARSFSDNDAFQSFAWTLHEIIPELPADLLPTALMNTGGNRRGLWLKVVEYVDRCGSLAKLMSQPFVRRRRDMAEVAEAYLTWDRLCNEHLARTSGVLSAGPSPPRPAPLLS